MKFRNNIGGRVFIAGLLALSSALAGQQEIDVNRPYDANGWPKPIPVSISGFTGEVDGVLKTDLLFMGIENVSPERAQYLISGSNASRVEGRVVARITKNQILAKAYTGGSLRAQTRSEEETSELQSRFGSSY